MVVCIGSPMIDITARVPYDFLQKYNLKPNDATSYNDSCSEVFRDLEKCRPTINIGGSITNTVRSAQSLLPFPGICSYVGAIGEDGFGTEIRQALEAAGINVFFEQIEDKSTGRCAVLLFEDSRSFITDLGASRYLSSRFIERNDIMNAIGKATYCYMSAFFLRISYTIVKKICEIVQTEQKILIFNIGAPFLCLQYSAKLKEILPYVKVMIGNEEESRQLAYVLGHDCKHIGKIGLFLLAQCNNSKNGNINEALVIITRGDKPLIVANKYGIKKFHVPPLDIKRKLNTNGAGDYFVGGFLANYIQNKSIQECVHGGMRMSLECIKKNSLHLS